MDLRRVPGLTGYAFSTFESGLSALAYLNAWPSVVCVYSTVTPLTLNL